jgi:putative transposase
VTVSRDPCGRWYVAFAVDVPEPEQLPATGRVVGIDLGVRGFAVTSDEQAHRKAISDCGWGTFRAMLEYKAARAGRRVTVIDRWFPSSKMCSACGYLLAALSLDVRHWTCPSCGTRHDRDINAAKNILAAGLAVAGGGNLPAHQGGE